jgi:excisionase family DNA binding protein
MAQGSDEMITVKQAAEILGITESGVLAAIRRAVLEARKFGPVWSISKQSVLNYRDNRAPTGPGKGKNR